MLANEEVKDCLKAAFPDANITVTGDGYHYTVSLISDAFEGQRKVKRQQAVYAALSSEIKQGNLHAISITAMTTDEAKEASHG